MSAPVTREDLPLAERLRLPFLTGEELAVLLALPGVREVRKLARLRRIPFVKVGRRYLFRIGDVVEALWSRHTPALSESEVRRRIEATLPPALRSKRARIESHSSPEAS